VNAELPNGAQTVASVANAVVTAAGATFGLSPRRITADDLTTQLQTSTTVAGARAGR
jgi:hypothetical protein